ncbi:MAG: VWA domain-containing protein [Gammaproteobacteria bacterium]|nr:VWA domain-containing protein [Gammaproteobacteria bacterium]
MTEFYQLQLLRPLWLLGIVPVIVLIWMAWQLNQQQGAWHRLIAPQFRTLLLGASEQPSLTPASRYGLLGLGTLWLIMLIALSGPSLKSVDMPAEKSQQGTVIILDLSLSMLADDIAPNRLSRLKFTLTDLLKQHPEMATGLVGYAQTAHTITPISEDNQTLLEILPSLNPIIMPAYGSEPLQGFQQANSLLEGAHINQGHIIWMTDDIETDQVEPLRQWIQAHDYSVSILMIGTQAGGAVHIPDYGLLKEDNGKIVMPTLPSQRFKPLGEIPKVKLNQFSLTEDNLTPLLPPVIANKKSTQDKQETPESEQAIAHPLDEGAWFILLLLPVLPILYRRGWIIALTSITTLPLAALLTIGSLGMLLHPNSAIAQSTSEASSENSVEAKLPDFIDVFKSMNQQGYQAWQKGNYQTALDHFEDTQWRASAEYRLGNYDKAALLFTQDKSAKGHYNRGNALAKSGKLEAAKEAYETAIKQLPTAELLANIQTNLKLVNKLIDELIDTQTSQSDSEQQPPKQSAQPTKPKAADAKQAQDQQQANEAKDSNAKTTPNSPDTNPSGAQKGANENSEATGDAPPPKSNGKGSDETDPSNPTSSLAQQGSSKGNQDDTETNQEAMGQIDSEQFSDAATQNTQADAALNTSKVETQDGLNKASRPTSSEKKAVLIEAERAKQQEAQQATQNWLKQIPDQPGLFLKRKFEYQFQQQKPTAEPGGHKQW